MKKRVQLKLSVCSMVMVLVFGGAIALNGAQNPSSSSGVPEITIGLVMPLTGSGAQVGQDQRDGFLLGLDRINKTLAGRLKINTVIDDSQAKNDLAAQAAIKQIQLYKVSLIVGAWTGPTITMAPICSKNEVLLLNNGAQGDQLAGLSPYLFNTIPGWRLNAESMADFLRKDREGLKRAAILYEQSASGHDLLRAFTLKWEALGGEIVDKETYQMDSREFRSLITKIKSSNPDVIVIVSTLDDVGIQITNQLKEARVPQTIATLAGRPWLRYTKGMENPAYEVISKNVIDPVVANQYKEKYNKEMEFYASQNYNATLIIEAILKYVLDQGKEVTGSNMREAFYKIGSFPVMGGTRVFNPKTNTATSDRLIYDTTNGKTEVIKTYMGETM